MPEVAGIRRSARRAHKLWRILGEPNYRRALRYGVAAAVEHDGIPYQTEFRTIVDAGANRGQFALVARRRFPGARLCCFEPLPGPRAKLEQILPGGGAAEVFAVALSTYSGSAEMHVTEDDDSSSLKVVGDRQKAEFPGTEEVRSTEVSTARLDEILKLEDIDSPALLKIDVQGSELDVLRGAETVLRAFDVVVVECSFVELYVDQPLAGNVIAFLAGHGLILCGSYNSVYGRQGVCLQADLVFERIAPVGAPNGGGRSA